MLEGDVSKRNLLEFTIVSNEIQYIVIRNSKSAGPRKCIAMDKLAQEEPLQPPILWGIWEISKTLVSHTEQIGQECTDETSIRLPNRSHINEPSPPRIRRRTCRTNPFSTVPKVAPVFFQFFMVAVEWTLVELISKKKIVAAGSFTTDGNLMQPTGCVNSTPHTSPFSHVCPHS